MLLLFIALFTGGAALERFDKGEVNGGWMLAAITLLLVLGGIVQMIRDGD